MPYFYARLKAAIQAAADILGREPKLALGSLGEMEWPTSGHGKKVRDTGQLWATGESPIDLVLQQLSLSLDSVDVQWAVVSTEASGAAPTIFGSGRMTGVTKNEVADTITITFDPVFLAPMGPPSYTVSSHVLSTATAQKVIIWQVDEITLQYIDVIVGGPLDIDKRTILVITVGAV